MQDYMERLKVAVEGEEEQNAVLTLAQSLSDYLRNSKNDDVIKALKASRYKPARKVKGSFFENLQAVSDMTQILRLAVIFEGFKDADLNYEDIDQIRYISGYGDYGYYHSDYKLPEKNYTRKQHSGRLSREHAALYKADCLKAELKNPGIEALSQPFINGLKNFYPRTKYWIRSEDKVPSTFNDANLTAALAAGITEDELAFDSLKNKSFQVDIEAAIKSNDASIYASKDDDIAQYIVNSLQIVPALQNFISKFDGTDALVDALEGFQTHHNSFLQIIESALEDFKQQKHYEQIASLIDSGGLVHPLTGQKYTSFKATAEDSAALLKALDRKSTTLPEALQQRFNLAAQLEQTIGSIVPDDNDLNVQIDSLGDLLKRVAPEVEKSLYCALKRSGHYGPANIAENFAVASQFCPLSDTRETTLEQMNVLLRIDLEMNGWQGEMPEGWDAQTAPDPAALLLHKNKPFYRYADKLNEQHTIEETIESIQADLNHRIEYAIEVAHYLSKAKTFTPPLLQAEIDSALKVISDDIIKPYQAFGAEYGFKFNAIEKRRQQKATVA